MHRNVIIIALDNETSHYLTNTQLDAWQRTHVVTIAHDKLKVSLLYRLLFLCFTQGIVVSDADMYYLLHLLKFAVVQAFVKNGVSVWSVHQVRFVFLQCKE